MISAKAAKKNIKLGQRSLNLSRKKTSAGSAFLSELEGGTKDPIGHRVRGVTTGRVTINKAGPLVLQRKDDGFGKRRIKTTKGWGKTSKERGP